jgi:hypothetical protein
VVYASNVERTARFWERLGSAWFFQPPDDGAPGYVGLRRGHAELAVVASEWSREQYGLEVSGAGGCHSKSEKTCRLIIERTAQL